MSSCQQAVARVTYKQMMGLRLVADVLVVHVGGAVVATVVFCQSLYTALHIYLTFIYFGRDGCCQPMMLHIRTMVGVR